MAGRLKARHTWLRWLVGGRAPGSAVVTSTAIYTILAAALCTHISAAPSPLLIPILLLCMIACKYNELL